VTHCFNSDEVSPANTQFVDEDGVCPFFTLSAGVCDSRMSTKGAGSSQSSIVTIAHPVQCR
jgi:hypothetical protein